MVAAHRHHLGQRDQQLATAATPSAALEGPDAVDGAVQPHHQVGAGGQLSGQQQAGVAGQSVVVGSDLDVAGAWATMHLTGVLPTGRTDVLATPFSNTEGTRLSLSTVLPSGAYSRFQI
jgi:hypothetical protein